jgi:hypothetical protein
MKHKPSIYTDGTTSEKSFHLLIIILLILQFSFLNLQCEKPTPTDDDKRTYAQSIELTKDDVGVTEAWLRVRFLDSLSGSSFKLTRNGQTILTTPSFKYDTVIIDNGLLPNQTYCYRAYRLRQNTPADSSTVVTLTTMDTTSHAFRWTSYVLGDGNSSLLNDVAIVNDTCVWAVGAIYIKDSTGQINPNAYNAAYWNGVKWELKRILMHDWGG